MSKKFILDTNILVFAQDSKHEFYMPAVQLISTLFNNCNKIAYNEKIMTEYYNHMNHNHMHGDFIKNWFKVNMKRGKFAVIITNPIDGQLNAALKLNRFHKNDFGFIELANSCPDKIIITEDSDYNAQIKSVLKEYNIDVWCIREALENI